MTHRKLPPIAAWLVILALSLCCSSYCLPVAAQTNDDLEAMKTRVQLLVKQIKYTEALPWLEKILAAEPDNARMHFYLGFALTAKALNTKDADEAKALRVRARAEFVNAKELKIDETIVDALISGIPPDGGASSSFSEDIAANSLMIEAEGFFGQGKLGEALADYKKALELDPKLYHAALFAGDVYTQKGDFSEAAKWYERAIAIDPTKETAYRYSATPLMRTGKTELARDRYIEAFITEPYNKFARAGLIQWGQATNTRLAHPDIKIPTSVSYDEKGDVKINLDINMLGGKDDGAFAWIVYGTTRSKWKKEQFAKQFPQESTYRHSLAEEADALRSVIKLATADEKKIKNLNPAIARLKKLNDEGLLEPFILLAQADEGISQDHPQYLKDNRDKLRLYVVKYVVTGGGN
ncbi:MAG TPA: tetratricopeptide repeat protein [Pyrinomonadaceae bacterium]|nr:tetratricopeptide repeat protein [Pyrinomonadaceae bacterium]